MSLKSESAVTMIRSGYNCAQSVFASFCEDFDMDRFADLQGTLICRELLNGLDLTTEEGRRHFKEARLLETVCSGCVRDVVQILKEDLNGIRA